MGRSRKGPQGPFLLIINIDMISGIKFSGLIPVKHPSPVGNADGYYLTPAQELARRQQQQQHQNRLRRAR